MPVILLYVIRRDVLARFFPGWDENALAEPLEIAVLGTLVLAVSPFSSGWPGRLTRCPQGRSAGGSSGSPSASASRLPTSWSGTPVI